MAKRAIAYFSLISDNSEFSIATCSEKSRKDKYECPPLDKFPKKNYLSNYTCIRTCKKFYDESSRNKELRLILALAHKGEDEAEKFLRKIHAPEHVIEDAKKYIQLMRLPSYMCTNDKPSMRFPSYKSDDKIPVTKENVQKVMDNMNVSREEMFTALNMSFAMTVAREHELRIYMGFCQKAELDRISYVIGAINDTVIELSNDKKLSADERKPKSAVRDASDDYEI